MKRRFVVVADQNLGTAGAGQLGGCSQDADTPELGARLAEACLKDTLGLGERFDPGPGQSVPDLVLSYRGDRAWFQQRASSAWLLIPQMGSDLSQCLDSALVVLGVQLDDQTLFLGPSTPHLPVRALQQAYLALEQCDVVVGPEEGEGLYLVGVRGRWPAGTLSPVRWGSAQAGQDVCRAVCRSQLTVALVEQCYALGAEEDLARLVTDLGLLPDGSLRHVRLLIEDVSGR